MEKKKQSILAVSLVGIVMGISGIAFADAAATFVEKCAVCHGARGEGKAGMTTPFDKSKSNEVTAEVITNGKPPKMPAFKERRD